MQLKGLSILLILLFILNLSVTAFASGTKSSRSSSGGTTSISPRSAEDITYEYGKAIFKGRNPRYGRLKYCVPAAGGNDLTKVKKSTLKPFAGSTAQELAENLYNCNDPSQSLFTVMSRTDLSALVYYLNKRHKLNLN